MHLKRGRQEKHCLFNRLDELMQGMVQEHLKKWKS
ncbi:unnamed protein product [Tenebrio molitor]|nr:unnamed protein product [Tenebrio molitor]